MYRIERDRSRFREIVRGRLRADLRRYLSTSELLGRRGERAVAIPIPQIELPRFHFGENKRGGVGQGAGEKGQPVDGELREGEGAGGAGEEAGAHVLEVEVELSELAQMLGEELALPRIEPRGDKALSADGGRYSGVRESGPKSLRHFRRTFRNALRRTIAEGEWDPRAARVVPIPDDERFRWKKRAPVPDSSAVIFHVMDVSGSMGREQKDIVRIKAFWIDTWLRSQYEGVEIRYIIHDAAAKEVDEETFYHTRESGGTRISSAYRLCADLIQRHYPASEWNLYCLHFSDGDNWGEDNETCMRLLREELLPEINLFCYGQVESPYGSGEFIRALRAAFKDQEEKLVLSEIRNKEAIFDSIRTFLGKGK